MLLDSSQTLLAFYPLALLIVPLSLFGLYYAMAPSARSLSTASTARTRSNEKCGGTIDVSNQLPSRKTIDDAAQIPVFDAEGREHRFGKLLEWAENESQTRKVLVIFVRHFFCANCQEYLKYLSSYLGSPSSLPPATKVVIIGCGAPSLIPMYLEESNCTFPLYTDPSRRLYSLLGMTQTMSLGRHPDYLKQSVLAMALRGISMGLKRIWTGDALQSGDYSQVGGEFFFKTTTDSTLGKLTTDVSWCHRMQSTRDHAGVPELKRVLSLEQKE